MLQLAPGLFDNSVVSLVLFWGMMVVFILYGQRIQQWMILQEVGRRLNRLKVLREQGRKEALGYLTQVLKPPADPTERLDQFLEYFTILPANLDPAGIVRKVDHVLTVRDDRIRAEIRALAPQADLVQASAMENIVEAATALNLLFKVVRHFYLLARRTGSLFVLAQLQMVMPLILKEAEAMASAIQAFKEQQPIGDGIGPLVTAKLMLERPKQKVARDTVMCEAPYRNRALVVVKAEGPAGTVGQPGNALEKLIGEQGLRPQAIIMVDASLKLEGERTGEVAEGVGAAIGGIGVDRYKIEEVAVKHGVPLYAVVIKQSILDAITVMKKEIADTVERVWNAINRLLDEKTKDGDRVILVGVGNTLGIGQ